MNKENNTPEPDEYGNIDYGNYVMLDDDVLSVEFEDGTEADCDILVVFSVNDRQYIALTPENFEGDEDDAPIYIYRYSETEDGEPILDTIEDDDEMDAVLDRLDEILDDQEFDDLVDAEEKD